MYRPEGYELLEVQMNKLAWSVKPDWKSLWFKGVLDHDGQVRKGDGVFFCQRGFRHFREPHVVGVRDARSCL